MNKIQVKEPKERRNKLLCNNEYNLRVVNQEETQPQKPRAKKENRPQPVKLNNEAKLTTNNSNTINKKILRSCADQVCIYFNLNFVDH